MVRLRFGIRHLLLAVVVATVLAQAFVWYEYQPPSDRVQWRWSVSRYSPTDHTSIIYVYESFGERDKPPMIAYLARMHVEPTDFPVSAQPPWFRDEDGRLFIEGRSVRYDTGSFQLYVGDLEKYQRTISLDEPHARFFDPKNGSLPDFDAVNQFWLEVVGQQ
jgi:hypothetical protein